MRKAMSVLISAIALLIGGFVFAPAASASGYGCDGNLISTYPMKTNGGTGTTWGEVYLYYSTADGGTNCAVAVDTYFSSSVKKEIGIYIYRCDAGTTPGSYCDYDQSASDDNNYYQYAGPRSVTYAANRCISLFGKVDNPTNGDEADVTVNASHC